MHARAGVLEASRRWRGGELIYAVDATARPYSQHVARRLAPRAKPKFTKDAAAGNTNKPLFDIFRKPQKRQRTDTDDEVEIV